MAIVEIQHTAAGDPGTTHLRAVLRGSELAALELRWPDRSATSATADVGQVEIRRLVVHPDAHGRGVAGRLFDRLLSLACERGIGRLDLTVHHGGVSICHGIGFRVTGDGYWDGPRRFVPMSLDLTNRSGLREPARTGHAIARLARSRLLEPPSRGAVGLAATA